MNIKNLISDFEQNYREYDRILGEFDSGKETDVSIAVKPAIKQYIEQLAKIENEVFEYRLKKILEEEHPYIPQINVEKISNALTNSGEDVPEIIQRFLNHRQEMLRILSDIPREKWERTGVHEMEGHIPLKEFVRRMIVKDREIFDRFRKLGLAGN